MWYFTFYVGAKDFDQLRRREHPYLQSTIDCIHENLPGFVQTAVTYCDALGIWGGTEVVLPPTAGLIEHETSLLVAMTCPAEAFAHTYMPNIHAELNSLMQSCVQANALLPVALGQVASYRQEVCSVRQRAAPVGYTLY